MIYTKRIQDAIHFSIKTHEVYQKQKRKGKDIAYVTHPLTAGLILAQAGADEDVVIAGILHDTIEDSIEEKKVTKQMLEERFGERVAELVDSVSEKDKGLSWEERKEAALEEIGAFSHDSLLVKSADVLSNTHELYRDFQKDGLETFKRFNAPAADQLIHTAKVIEVIKKAWSGSPLYQDLESAASEVTTMSGAVRNNRKLLGMFDVSHINRDEIPEVADKIAQEFVDSLNKTVLDEQSKEEASDSFAIRCGNCGKDAAVVSVFKKDVDRPHIKVDGFISNVRIYEDSVSRLSERFRMDKKFAKESLSQLHESDPDIYGFVCRRCAKAYCKNCWKGIHAITEDGFYDESRGTCPEGHEQMVQD